MNWIELSVQTDAEGAEAAAALLNEMVETGAAIEQTIIPDAGEKFDPARAFTVRAFFSSDQREQLQRVQESLWHLAQLRPLSEPRVRELAEEDWAEAWKKYYTILHVGKHLVIKPSWLKYAPRADDIVIELDPGMAFGTGLHPTTRLCMLALEEYQTGAPRVLDVGTGSGILSITAAKLGAREILARDIDPVAVETATRNVAINRAESVVRVERGSIDAACNPFDLICINILAEVIVELAPALSAALRPGGIVIASGILDFKSDDVVDALNAVGIEIVEKKQEEDWVALIGRMKSTLTFSF
ncbi:MAG: 50S ribosomal protein L11 methyltransferase [Anaerolineales bacterium]|nr:50S ribosomal protein L11 methyltransferase [Anaerolineales bacterium]